MDLFYRDPEKDHNCTLVREQSRKIKQSLAISLKPLMRDLEVVFVFLCLKELVDRLKEKVGTYINTLDETQLKKVYK